jgi:glucose/arabinose dehydrogenase
MARLAGLLAALAAIVVVFVGFASARTAAAGDPALLSIGTFSSPIYVTAPPGDGERVFVVEQGGLIRIVKNGTTLGTAFLDLTGPVKSGGEQGLLSLAFAPDYAASGRFYVYYTADSPVGELTIAEFRRSANSDLAEPVGRIVLSIPHPTHTNHNGGQLQFGPDGYLYIATGDGGGGGDPDENAQDLNELLGKILRIDPLPAGGMQYTIPPDNPFVEDPAARDEIWAYGLRNPWRFSFDRASGHLAIADVGQGSWEEVNFSTTSAGRGRALNFGWGCWEGRHVYGPNSSRADCSPLPPNHTNPVHEYDHDRGCSITGGYVVRDPALPALAGRYVYGDFCDGDVWSVVLSSPDASGDAPTGLNVPSLASFGEDACGRVYAASRGGTVYRLHAEGSPSPATCTPTAPPSGPPPAPPPPAAPAPPPPPVAAQPRPICRVPRVIGQRPARARVRVRRANCRVGRLRHRRAARLRGRILTQSPRPGSRRPRGARVHMTVSRGRPR